jgi:hypothetical protein
VLDPRKDLEIHVENDQYWAKDLTRPGCFASGRNLRELSEALVEAMAIYDTDNVRTVPRLATLARALPDEMRYRSNLALYDGKLFMSFTTHPWILVSPTYDLWLFGELECFMSSLDVAAATLVELLGPPVRKMERSYRSLSWLNWRDIPIDAP